MQCIREGIRGGNHHTPPDAIFNILQYPKYCKSYIVIYPLLNSKWYPQS